MPARVPLRVAELAASYDRLINEENARAARAVVRPAPRMWLTGSRFWTATQLHFGQGGENGEPPALVQAVLDGDAGRLDNLLHGLKEFIAQQLPNELGMPAPGQLGAEAALPPPAEALAPTGELTPQQVDQKRTAAFASIINGRWAAFRLSSAATQLNQGSTVELHADTTLLLLAAKLWLPDVIDALLRHSADPRLVDGKGCCPLTAVITSLEARRSLTRTVRTIVLLLEHGAPVTRHGFNRQQTDGQTRTAPADVEAQLEDDIIRFDSAGLASAPLVTCAQLCYEGVHLPCSILQAVLAAALARMDADEWLAAVQVAIFASHDDLVKRAVNEVPIILMAVDHRTSQSAADVLLRLAIRRGMVAAVEALASLVDTGNSSMLVKAAMLRKRNVLAALISSGFQPCTRDVFKLMDAKGLVRLEALVTYLEAAGRAPAVELSGMVQNMARWLSGLVGGAGLPCPMLHLMVKRSLCESRRVASSLYQDLRLMEVLCRAGYRPTAFNFGAVRYNPLVEIPRRLMLNDVNRLPMLAALKPRWSVLTHTLFPKRFKATVCTLLLCANRLVTTSTQPDAYVILQADTQACLMSALAYPLSSWVSPWDCYELGDTAPMEAALDIPQRLCGPSAWTTESADTADVQLFQQQYGSNEDWVLAEEFVGAERDTLQRLNLEDQVDELMSAVQRLTIE